MLVLADMHVLVLARDKQRGLIGGEDHVTESDCTEAAGDDSRQ